MRSAAEGAAALAAELREAGGALAGALASDPVYDPEPGPGQLASRGPRAAGREAEYELLVEMILEGSRLHYGRPRVLETDDPDLALLLGDQLYALGLARLADLGDLEAVGELADLISLVAQAEAGGHDELAGAVWRAGATAIGWGTTADYERAKSLARAGHPDAAKVLHSTVERPVS